VAGRAQEKWALTGRRWGSTPGYRLRLAAILIPNPEAERTKLMARIKETFTLADVLSPPVRIAARVALPLGGAGARVALPLPPPTPPTAVAPNAKVRPGGNPGAIRWFL